MVKLIEHMIEHAEQSPRLLSQDMNHGKSVLGIVCFDSNKIGLNLSFVLLLKLGRDGD